MNINAKKILTISIWEGLSILYLGLVAQPGNKYYLTRVSFVPVVQSLNEILPDKKHIPRIMRVSRVLTTTFCKADNRKENYYMWEMTYRKKRNTICPSNRISIRIAMTLKILIFLTGLEMLIQNVNPKFL